MNPKTAAEDLAPLLERAFFFSAVEDSYIVEDISGVIPRWLRGTYYINGPARFERAGMRYKHWLDGDGMVCALRFGDDAIRFTNRFVQTPKLRDEEAAGRLVYRGFGTSFPGDKLRRGLMLEPPINVSAYPFAGTLLAFGEQALPFELDPVTLETRGEYDFDGKLSEVTPFSAHAKWDPSTGHMVNFGVSFSAVQPTLNVYEFDRNGAMLRRRRHPLKYQHSIHDFALSDNYVVFHLGPLLMDFNKFWQKDVSVMEALSWEPDKGTTILVAPRESKSETAFVVNAGRGYSLHLTNCFESEGGLLIVDLLELEAPVYPEYQPVPDMFRTVTPCRPVRFVIHVPSKTLVERREMEYGLAPDFPSFDKRLTCKACDDFWMLGISATGRPGRKFFDQLAHGNWKQGAVKDIYRVSPGEYLGGEPAHVANPKDAADAVIITEYLDAWRDRAEILLFEAGHVAKGPIARLGLRHKIHLGFHTSFQPSAR